MRVGTQTINDLLAKADYEQATLDEKFHLACDLWDIDGDFPNLDLGARSSEKPGIIKSIDDSISRTKKVSDTFMTNLQKRDPEAYAMMEKALGWGATVAQAAAFINPYTAVGAGAVMVADASGATDWVKQKISAGLKEIGFEKSSDTLAAGLMFVVEGKAQKKATQAAAGSKVLNGIVEKSGHKFESVSGKFHPDPIVWTAPTGTGQTYKVFQRTDIEWNLVRTDGAPRFIGKTNLEAAKNGVPPQLAGEHFVQIHHIGQNAKGPLVEVSTKHHHFNSKELKNGKKPFDVLHSQHGKKRGHPDNPVDHSKWKVEREAYWKRRVEEVK